MRNDINDTIDYVEENNPYNELKTKEFNDILLKFGSLLFILNNKPINASFLFLKLIECEKTRGILLKILHDTNFITICKLILYRYPKLIKSKMLKKASIKILKIKKNVN